MINIIEDGYNTNYISCLLLTLFLENNTIYKQFLECNNFIYLQEIIKKIINDFKNYNIVNSQILNYFRNIIYFNNFKEPSTILNNNSIIELYNFLYNKFDVPKIEILNITDRGNIERFNYLVLNYTHECNNIKKLINYNYSKKLLNNIPLFLGFYLIRNDNMIIDIQKKISMNTIYSITSVDKLIWKIYFIICCQNNNYYSFINYNDTWIMINQNNIPALEKINIKNYESDIKKNGLFIMYKFEK